MNPALWIVALAASAAAAPLTLRPAGSIQLPSEARRVALSPAGNQVAVLCSDRKLRLLSLPAGKIEAMVGSDDERITAFSYSPDGRWLAVGTWSGMVELIPASGSAGGKKWKAGSRRIAELVFSHDGKTLVAGALDRPGRVWSVSGEPELLAELHADFAGLTAAAFSPDGRLLVTADGDTVIRLYKTSPVKEIARNEDAVLETFAVGFTRDGKHALIGGVDGVIKLLDPSTGKAVRSLARQEGMVTTMTALPDGRHVAAAYLDINDIRKPPLTLIWDLHAGTSETINISGSVSGWGLVKDEFWIATAKEKTVELWRIQ